MFRVTYWQVCKTYGVPPSEIWQPCMTTITWAPKITSASMCTYEYRNPPLCSYDYAGYACYVVSCDTLLVVWCGPSTITRAYASRDYAENYELKKISS